jgi:AAA+ ATPase superfamily predicted ATPase
VRQFNLDLTLRENIIKNVLTKGCVLYSEVEFLIRQELREPALYNTIIEAIALGNTQHNDIYSRTEKLSVREYNEDAHAAVNVGIATQSAAARLENGTFSSIYTKTQIEKTKISVYLKNLIELQILEREFSLLSAKGATSSIKEQATSTRGLYRITDNFFRCWYSFVFPNISDLETGDAEGIYKYTIEPQLNNFASPIFETVCREFLRRKNRLGELPFRISHLGRWWGKLNKTALTDNGIKKPVSTDSEIDIVALDSNANYYILAECKFLNSETDVDDLERLIEKSTVIKKGANVIYAMFSKSGFTKKLAERAKTDKNLYLISLSDIL